MLIVNPELDARGKDLALRPSQKKYESEDTQFMIVRCGTFSQGSLNRQIIMLLSSRGVADDYFKKKMTESQAQFKPERIVKRLQKCAKEINENEVLPLAEANESPEQV